MRFCPIDMPADGRVKSVGKRVLEYTGEVFVFDVLVHIIDGLLDQRRCKRPAELLWSLKRQRHRPLAERRAEKTSVLEWRASTEILTEDAVHSSRMRDKLRGTSLAPWDS